MKKSFSKCLFLRRAIGLLIFVSVGVISLTLRSSGHSRFVQAANLPAILVNIIDTSLWSPNSPDPSGIDYRASTNSLLVSDAEVEEMPPYFVGKNVFESSLGGSLGNTYSTTSFSNEPTGVAINSANGHIFYSDDNKKKVFEVNLGDDGLYGTADDTITSFSTSAFNSNDPEGLAYGEGKLFIADGVGTEVYTVDPGINGNFDGVVPTGDDQVTHFDTSGMTQADPEGIAYNTDSGTLYIVSNNGGRSTNRITETTTAGVVVNVIDISFLNARSTAGLAYGPGSVNPAVNNIYIAARGVDNGADPNENDGKIYEITLSVFPSPTPSVEPSPTGIPVPTPTPIPSTNLLTNPGFELDANNDGRPDSWSSKSYFTRSGAVVLAGTYVGRHLSASNNGYIITQTVSGITAGRTYNFSGWTNIPATSDSFTYRLQVRWLNSSGSAINTKTAKTYTAATAGWNQAVADLVAPTGAVTAVIRMNVSSLNAQIYADEFSFTAL